MKQKNLIIDIEYCTGCHACEIACKQENNLPAGYNWINVLQVGPRMVGNRLRMDYVPMRCKHCAKAPCIEACPEKAITKRSDGIVVIDHKLCIGCMSCAEACPFGVIALDPEKQVASMCNLCMQLTANGQDPACVHHCPSKCIYYGETNEILKNLREKAATRMVEETKLA